MSNVHTWAAVALASLGATSCSGGGSRPPVDAGADGFTFDVGAADRADGGVSFLDDVYPIIAASCALAGCHDMGITTNHWTDYTTAEATYSRWVNGPGFDFCVDQPSSGIYTSRVIVVPGDPVSSYLLLKIAPPTEDPCQDPTHHRRMPPAPMDPLPPAAMDAISRWIAEGALAN